MARWHANSEGKTPSCGCLKYTGFKTQFNKTFSDLTGRRFENLLVIEIGPVIKTGKDEKKRRTWKCLCDCGQITYVTTGDLLSGNTKSCGCLISIGEKHIAELLLKAHIDFISQYSFDDLLSGKGNPLRFDFGIFKDNRLQFLLEYQGVQHYTAYDCYFGRQQRLVTDKMKKRYCEQHNIPLFEIAYNEDIESKLDKILKSFHDNTVPSSENNSEKV